MIARNPDYERHETDHSILERGIARTGGLVVWHLPEHLTSYRLFLAVCGSRVNRCILVFMGIQVASCLF